MATDQRTVVERGANDRPNSAPDTRRQHTFGVYVAGSSAPSEAARVTAAIATLRAHGFRITSSWPDVVAKVGDANPRDASPTDRRGWATQCLNEIDESDAVWVLVPDLPTTTRGAWGEQCYAYSEKKHLVSSGDTKQSVFSALGYEFATDAAAIAHLKLLRGLDEVRDANAMDLRVKHALVCEGGSSER